jgi:exosortase
VTPVLRSGWALWLVVLLLAAATWFGAAGALASIHESWTSIYGPFAHGYVILGLALVLAWRLWRREPPRCFESWWPPLALLAAATAALWAMELMFLNSARQVLVPVIIWAAAATVLGKAAGRLLFWPLAFLYFALPQWWVINTPLQQLTAEVANALVWTTGVPAYVEGNSFHLPAGIVEVANGCSGLNYLVVALALALFQGLSYIRSWRLRWRLLAAAAVVALLSNWLRVYALIVIGYATDMQHYLIRVDHLYFGWVLFLVCMWPVFVYAARLEHSEAPPVVATPLLTGEPTGAQIALSPLAVLACALLITAPLLLLDRLGRDASLAGSALPPLPAPNAVDLVALAAPLERTAWQQEGVGVEFGRWQIPRQTRATHLSGDPIEVFMAQDASGWRIGGQAASEGLEWTELSRESVGHGATAGGPLLARVGYRVAGVPLAGGGRRFKLALLSGGLRGRRDAEVWVLLTPCQPDCASGRRRLDAAMPRVGVWMGSQTAAVL